MARQKLLQTAKPILFNTEMVQAIQSGRKTQTRRLIKPQPNDLIKRCECCDPINICDSFDIENIGKTILQRDNARCLRHYNNGDILYVRETWCRLDCSSCDGNYNGECCSEPDENDGCYLYRATYYLTGDARWKPSIHMPKEAARIFLRVTDVRAERLQDIDRMDIKSEGIHIPCLNCNGNDDCNERVSQRTCGLYKAFMQLWNRTIKKYKLNEYGWNANPWVWVYEFERIDYD